MTEEKKYSLTLEVLQWNVIISAINPMFFAETQSILAAVEGAVKALNEQKIEKKGHDTFSVELTRRDVETLIVLLQNLPYNVVARIMYALFALVQKDVEAEATQALAQSQKETEEAQA